MNVRRVAIIWAVLLCGAGVPGARAQVGTTTDILTGVVTDETGAPLAGAVVEAQSIESEITRRVRTDSQGRYTILFPDGGGAYQMTARYLGMRPEQVTLQRFADEDRLEWNPRLAAAAIVMDTLTVRAPPRAVIVPDLPTPGSTERAFTEEMLSRLPLDQEDLNALASLVPGVVAMEATDSTAAAYSVGGLRLDANAFTVDGLNFGGSSLPQEGLRSTRVITGTYDVSRGQFSGGLVASTTRGGSNMIQGSSGYALRDQALAFGVDSSSPFAQGFTQNQLSGGLGGPLAKDRLFWFASGQARLRSDAQQTLLSATPTDLERLGVLPDSVDRFVTTLGALGVSPTAVQPQGGRATDNYSGLLRLDYLINNAHTLTLRGDWHHSRQDPARLSPLALPQTGGLSGGSGGGGMVSLTSRFGMHVINQVQTYLSRSVQNSEPFLTLPAGRVQVGSQLPDGSIGVGDLSFGGSTGMPSSARTTGIQATDEVSWLPGAARHRVKLGAYLQAQASSNLNSANTTGTFTFNSLADLAANTPASFTRTLAPADRLSHALDYAFYAADIWGPTRRFQVTYGLRLEGSSFVDPPAYNAVVDSLFGLRTDRLPAEWHLSPRAGFTWTIGGSPFGGIRAPQQPALIVRGGVGEFRSPIPGNLVTAAQASTGLPSSEAQIVCVGSDVPLPDWSAYAADPGAIPDACTGGVSGLTSTPNPNVALFAPGFTAPRAWRASLGLQKNLTQILRLSVDAGYTRGTSQYGFRDLNLVATPAFTVGDEGGRPVYVPAGTIDAATGAVPFTASRVDTALGQVIEVGSDLASEAEQFTFSLAGVTRHGAILQIAYTLAFTRDQSSASRFGLQGFASATTAGDPNVREWAASDFDRRHAFLGVVTYPFGADLELTGIGRLSSGAPFTPMVASDINGDGARNDRAFIFDPAGSTPEAAAMGRLLASADPRVAACLASQIGQVAQRNSCRGPWQGSFDMQLNYRPDLLALHRRLTVSVVTVNLLRGVDELVHGSANAAGWGLTLRPDPNLLYVTGFDPATHAFTYAVNERFGATGSGANALRAPFQIGIQARFTIGPDRMQAALDQLRGLRGGGGFGGRGGFGGGFGGMGRPGGAFAGAAAGGAGFAERLASLLPNPPAQVLELRDTLRLTPGQVTLLEAARDSLGSRTKAVAAALQALTDSVQSATQQAQRGSSTPDFRGLFTLLRPKLEEARANVREALEAVHAILTRDQWNRVPDRIRNPRTGPPRGAGARPPER
jgi:Carboxypeptidase regulatory-like domain